MINHLTDGGMLGNVVSPSSIPLIIFGVILLADIRKPPQRQQLREHPSGGSMERQLGEVVATLRAFHEDISEVKQSIQALDTLQRESSLDRRTQQQFMTGRIEALERTTSDQHRANTEVLTDLRSDIVALKGPVGQWIDLRKRAGATLLIITGIGSVLWTLAEPVYSFIATKLLGH